MGIRSAVTGIKRPLYEEHCTHDTYCTSVHPSAFPAFLPPLSSAGLKCMHTRKLPPGLIGENSI